MPEELAVHVSREEINDLDVPVSFAAEGSFDVVFLNHGTAVHVHLHLDDALSRVASLDAGNHYVEGESRRAVRVTVDVDAIPTDGVAGKLKVVTAYGAQTRWIDVTISAPSEQESTVRVDESLGEPRPPQDEQPATVFTRPERSVLALAVLTVVIALIVAVLVREPVVFVGTLVVFGGATGALYFLLE